MERLRKVGDLGGHFTSEGIVGCLGHLVLGADESRLVGVDNGAVTGPHLDPHRLASEQRLPHILVEGVDHLR